MNSDKKKKWCGVNIYETKYTEREKRKIPLPGFEPGSPGWKPGILTGLDDNGFDVGMRNLIQ